MEVLEIAICEDSNEEKENLISLLKQINIATSYTVFSSSEALLKNYELHKFDLLLMDIYMEGITGLSTVQKIREIDDDTPVAFITTSTDHALDSYRLSALKYIEKPFKKKDIKDILELALMKKNNKPSLVVQKNGKIEKIPFSQILYLEQQIHQLHIYLSNGECVQIYDKLSTFLPLLAEQFFFQSHKSFCINLSFVRFIDVELKCFTMQNNKNVPIRRESMSKAKKSYESFLFYQARRLL